MSVSEVWCLLQELVSLLERCPHVRGASMELRPEDVSLLERYPRVRWYMYDT